MRTIAAITANNDFTLDLIFSDGIERHFDVEPLLAYEAFQPLRDIKLFRAFHNRGYFIEWECGADLSADTLYLTTKTDEPSYHAVARLFGIEEPQSIVDQINIVRHGLPSEGVTALSDKLGITHLAR